MERRWKCCKGVVLATSSKEESSLMKISEDLFFMTKTLMCSPSDYNLVSAEYS